MREVLTGREETVLLGLLVRFVESFEPVGSRVLSEESPERLSPASIRATLCKLEDKGYLTQPHTSAGRIPTDMAYRFFAEQAALLSSPATEADPGEVDRLAAEGSLNGVVRGASALLSRATHALGFAATPPLDSILLRECELVALSKDRVLLVVVSQGGQVHECALKSPRPLGHDILRVFSNILNESFRGLPFVEIRSRLRAELEAQGVAFMDGLHQAAQAPDGLAGQSLRHDLGPEESTREALRLVAPYFFGERPPRHLFYEGVELLLASPALRDDLGILESLIETLQTKGRLLELLEAFAQEGAVVRTVMGNQWPGGGTRALSMVISPFEAGPEGAGLVGVIGPKSMRYDRTVPIVRSVARCVSLAGARL